MTREEAIKVLNRIQHLTYRNFWDEECDEAIDMAIEALQAEPMRSKCEVDAKSDLISRADAIEAVCDKCPISFKNKCEWKDNGHCSMKVALEALPSADAVHGVGRYEKAMQKLREMPRYLNGVKEKQITKISADAVPHGRLIDADSLISCLEEWKENPNNDDSSVDLVNHFIGIIRSAPSAESVVRCKDCRHYKKINPKAKSGMCYKDIVASAWNDDGFCSRGERREP